MFYVMEGKFITRLNKDKNLGNFLIRVALLLYYLGQIISDELAL